MEVQCFSRTRRDVDTTFRRAIGKCVPRPIRLFFIESLSVSIQINLKLLGLQECLPKTLIAPFVCMRHERNMPHAKDAGVRKHCRPNGFWRKTEWRHRTISDRCFKEIVVYDSGEKHVGAALSCTRRGGRLNYTRNNAYRSSGSSQRTIKADQM